MWKGYSWIEQKWIISTLGMFSCSLMYMQHAGMSGAIVRMTKPYSTNSSSNNEYHSNVPRFEWDETLQGLILGGVFYLYWIVPTIIGLFTDVCGGKWLTFVGVFVPGILTAMTPWAATKSVTALIIVQTLIGGTQGFIFPSLFHLYVQWFPPEQRSYANAGIQVGQSIGGSLMYLIVGYLCETSVGWPMVFYAECAFYIPWLVLWIIFAADKPNYECYWHNENDNKKTIRPPWFSIATSGAVWASILSKIACSFGFFMLLSKLPTYLDSTYGMPIIENGVINAAAFSAYGLSSFIAPYIANYMIQKTRMSKITIRNLFQGICMLIPAFCLIMITMVDKKSIVIGLLIMAMFSYGFVTAGEWTMVSEYAPNFVGIVSGFALMLGLLNGVFAPYIVGLILDSNIGTLNLKWNLAFYISSILYILCYGAFLFLSSVQQQPWDKVG